MKSARRPGSSMLMAMVCRSSESVGEEVTICWNWLTTLRCMASISADGAACGLGDGLVLGGHEGGHLGELAQADALGAFGEDEEALVGHLDDLMHGRAGADGVQVGAGGRVLAGVALGDDQDGLAFAKGLNELDGALAADGQGQNGVGKEDRIAHREDGKREPVGWTGRGLAGLFSAAWADDTDKVVWH